MAACAPVVELVFTRLHAGGKFSNNNYTFSGGLHGVGVSVVNALSTLVEVHIKREGAEHRITFRTGDRATPLEVVGSVGKKNTGTRVRFWPDPKYFDTPKFAVRALKHLLRAKAVLCPGLTVKLTDEATAGTGRARITAGRPVRRQPEEGHRGGGLGRGLAA
ncbi:hypothetical protein G6F32_014817 [Rhizopus arrhizus]|nr:hypothetical protein G6F32_014817 [Rhizopus arrhizus]